MAQDLEALIEEMGQATGVRPSRSQVLRAVVERGIAVLRKELARKKR